MLGWGSLWTAPLSLKASHIPRYGRTLRPENIATTGSSRRRTTYVNPLPRETPRNPIVADSPTDEHYPNRITMSMSVEDSAVAREGFPRPVPNTPSNVMEQFNMSGKVAVVTGAADGIGYAVAEGLAEAGASVALLYNS